MRIGIDITAAVRQGAGIGRFTRELVRALLALDSPHEYVLFAATGGLPISVWQPRLDYITQTARALDLKICNLKSLSDDWLHRMWHRARLGFPIEFFTGRVDLFHEPDFVLPPTRRGTLTLLTVHDLTFMRDPDSALPQLRRYLEQVVPRSVQRATHVLADSLATKKDLAELFSVSPDKITVIPGGVSDCFSPVTDPARLAEVRAKYNLGPDPFILGLGTIQPRKNYTRLIQAFATFRTKTIDLKSVTTKFQFPTFNLVIVGGKGWMYDDIFAEVKRQGLEEYVLFPGFVDDDDLPALYSAASVLAYPSLYEGFGLPVLEAMACGTPVVTSNTSSLPEIAGDAALAVSPTNPVALSGALLNAVADEALRAQMIERGLKQARRFTWEDAARQLLAVYEQFKSS